VPHSELLSDNEIATLARRHGFTGTGLVDAIAVCLAESGGNIFASNTKGNKPPSTDRGLWQLNDHYHPEVSDKQAYDPNSCCDAAYRISDSGRTWDPWSTYISGAYREFLPRAEAAVSATVLSTPYTLTRTLREWMNGEDVKRVQIRVGAKVDGVYGPATMTDVARWQRAHHISADGIFGPQSAKTAGWLYK
jgi:peptidoglycan hydrolase-like protein with peptidoglycan-binding domain